MLPCFDCVCKTCFTKHYEPSTDEINLNNRDFGMKIKSKNNQKKNASKCLICGEEFLITSSVLPRYKVIEPIIKEMYIMPLLLTLIHFASLKMNLTLFFDETGDNFEYLQKCVHEIRDLRIEIDQVQYHAKLPNKK